MKGEMNKYLIGVGVAVLALTGCDNTQVLEMCYAESEEAVKDLHEERVSNCIYSESIKPWDEELSFYESSLKKQANPLLMLPVEDRCESMIQLRVTSFARVKYGVSVEGYITQAGKDRCKRLIELGEYPLREIQ